MISIIGTTGLGWWGGTSDRHRGVIGAMRVARGTRLAPFATSMHLHNAFAHTAVDDLQPIYVRADPNGLAYDHHAGTLFVADSYSGAVIAVDGERQRRIATIDSAGVIGARVGGLAITPYGTLFATRIGHGRVGTIFRIEPDGQMEPLDRLPVEYKRVGVTYDAREHALYTTQFRGSVHGAHDGSIVVVDLVTGEPSTVIDGFLKPLGIVKLGPTIVVADARQRAVFRVDMASGRAVLRLQLAGDLDRPDSLCACGLDSVLATTYDEDQQRGSLRRLWLDGRHEVIASGAWHPRGVTTDGDRAYVAMKRGGQVMVFMIDPSGA